MSSMVYRPPIWCWHLSGQACLCCVLGSRPLKHQLHMQAQQTTPSSERGSLA